MVSLWRAGHEHDGVVVLFSLHSIGMFRFCFFLPIVVLKSKKLYGGRYHEKEGVHKDRDLRGSWHLRQGRSCDSKVACKWY